MDGWRLGPAAPAGLALRSGAGAAHMVTITGTPDAAAVSVDAVEPVPASARRHGTALTATVAGETRHYRVARAGADIWLAGDAATLRLTEIDRLAAEGGPDDAATVGAIRSPMPGSVMAVEVAVGDAVDAGQALVTVEAMKMEHTLVAPASAIVAQVAVTIGAQVAMDELLVLLEATDD